MLSFIIAIAAGFATPHAEPFVFKGMNAVKMGDFPLQAGELRTLTFILLMLAVSILTLGSDISAFPIILGGGLGLFGVRLFNTIKAHFTS